MNNLKFAYLMSPPGDGPFITVHTEADRNGLLEYEFTHYNTQNLETGEWNISDKVSIGQAQPTHGASGDWRDRFNADTRVINALRGLPVRWRGHALIIKSNMGDESDHEFGADCSSVHYLTACANELDAALSTRPAESVAQEKANG